MDVQCSYNPPTIPLQSPYYGSTQLRARNECIDWRAAWLNRQKEKAKEKKNQKKEKEKEKALRLKRL